MTASEERRKRKAFADIERSGHSKQTRHAVSCVQRTVVRQRRLRSVDRITTMSSPQGLLFLLISPRLELVQFGRPQAKRDASEERRKRRAFADIERSGHSKQSKRDSVEPKAKCIARIV